MAYSLDATSLDATSLDTTSLDTTFPSHIVRPMFSEEEKFSLLKETTSSKGDYQRQNNPKPIY
ncbi:MAG: hypothetical protein ACTTJJ_06055 [Prevotella fusca]|uniref:hypothetical protein n=1 Tax=Prevotella fusca TaxID=589436 RepID=UPI003F9F6D44